MGVFDLELLAGKHARLEDNGHFLTFDKTILKIQVTRNVVIVEAVEMFLRIDRINLADRPNP